MAFQVFVPGEGLSAVGTEHHLDNWYTGRQGMVRLDHDDQGERGER